MADVTVEKMITEIMTHNDWSQQEFADHFKIQASQVTRWLKGITRPNYDNLMIITDAYNKIKTA